MAKGKTKRKTRTSSGLRARNRAHRALKRLEMKVARWKRYQTDVVKGALRSWSTEGLEKHLSLLQKLASAKKKK